jgi:hypothetical protein
MQNSKQNLLSRVERNRITQKIIKAMVEKSLKMRTLIRNNFCSTYQNFEC